MVCQMNYLSELIENQATVSIYLKHGIKLTSKITGATETVIFLSDLVPQMIYKNSVSTVIPNADFNK